MAIKIDSKPRGIFETHRPSFLVWLAFGLLVVLSLCGLFADLLATNDYTDQSLRNRFQPPVWMGGNWT